MKSVLFVVSQRCPHFLESVLTHIESRSPCTSRSLNIFLFEDHCILLFPHLYSPRISSTISPRIGKVRGVSHAAPVCAEIILRRRKVPVARKGGRHSVMLEPATNKSVLWKLLKCIGGRVIIKVNGSRSASLDGSPQAQLTDKETR